MNTNEKCLLNYLSDSERSAFNATGSLIKFLGCHNRKIEFNSLSTIYNIIDEMEFNKDLYEQENLD